MFACSWKFSDATVSELIKLGSEVNARDEDGMTSLHHSYWCDNESSFELLLSKGANPDQEDEEGDTVRSLAADKPVFMAALSDI
jgi:SH3/ankyrin repeat-containing protein